MPVLASLYGDETWVIAAGLFNNGISIWCHQPHDTLRKLMSPNFEAFLSDDIGTGYSSAGGSGQAFSGQARYRFDFTPRPPVEANTIRLRGFFNDTGQKVALEPGTDRLQVTIRLRGTPGIEATSTLVLGGLPGLDLS